MKIVDVIAVPHDIWLSAFCGHARTAHAKVLSFCSRKKRNFLRFRPVAIYSLDSTEYSALETATHRDEISFLSLF